MSGRRSAWERLAELDKSPAFQAETLDGRHMGVDSAGNRNPVLLVFWATWCPHCLVEIPNINRLHAKFAPKGLESVAINVGINDSVARVQLAKQKFGISYPIVFDQGGKITKLYQITVVPSVAMVYWVPARSAVADTVGMVIVEPELGIVTGRGLGGKLFPPAGSTATSTP